MNIYQHTCMTAHHVHFMCLFSLTLVVLCLYCLLAFPVLMCILEQANLHTNTLIHQLEQTTWAATLLNYNYIVTMLLTLQYLS